MKTDAEAAPRRARSETRVRALRWLIQLFLLLLFALLFGRVRYGLSPDFTDVFFRFDPLVFIVTSIATRTLLVAGLLSLAVVAGTLFFGRFFCGFVCPLGTTIDLADAVLRRKSPPAAAWRRGKFLTLVFLAAAAAAGTSFVGFFDPLAILSRSLALVFYPTTSHFAGLVSSVRPAVFAETMLALATLLVILGLGFAAPRFWCRNLCPLGGLLGLASKFSLLKFSFRGDCRTCGLCEKACPTGAIDSQHRKVDAAECIGCLACLRACPDHVIRYAAKLAPQSLDVGRREALVALGSGLVAAPLARSVVHARLQGRLLRPPGSIPEPDFLNACIRCGRCMKACPTNGLQPAILESGFDGLWTPRLVPRVGACEKNCNLCGQVCPTGAIRNLPLEEKTYARIGTAVVDRSRCLAWEQDRACLVCDEACPYNAIDSRNETLLGTTLGRPFVNEAACVGCGLCESRCPVDGPAAIQVFSMAADRRQTGWYKTPEKARLRSCGDEPQEDIPSGFIQD
ncbi:4Fe-4S binding protein [candidate division WOR-3 bacterium]|nr:4Fe-4S binding protein [candidate division WOR-3 bacterium]